MKNIIISTFALLLSFTSYSVAEEFNENLLYTGTINSAYNQVDLPMLPGNWKIYDLEKSGSVPSGNFYVFATLVPQDTGPNDNAVYFDNINFGILGSKSEETDYRRTFFGCDSGFYSAAETKTKNIVTRGSGNFEETCSVAVNEEGDAAGNLSNQFYYTDCGEVCVEVSFSLYRENYNLNADNFGEFSEKLFGAIRNTVSGSGDGSLEFLSDYKS